MGHSRDESSWTIAWFSSDTCVCDDRHVDNDPCRVVVFSNSIADVRVFSSPRTCTCESTGTIACSKDFAIIAFVVIIGCDETTTGDFVATRPYGNVCNAQRRS